MILGFKQKFPNGKPTNFAYKIFQGTKIHSIREDANDRWKERNIIHMAHGVRTKNYRCFKKDTCNGIQIIEIEYVGTSSYLDAEVKIDGRILSKNEIDIFAKNDGFYSTNDFFEWFSSNFKGKIIHWTEFRY